MSCMESKKVTSRKLHLCLTCGRYIPAGTRIVNHHGIYENEFIHWYECMFCYEHVQIPDDDSWTLGEPLDYWFEEQKFKCPECGGMIRKYRFDKADNRDMVLMCDECGRIFKKHIGYF